MNRDMREVSLPCKIQSGIWLNSLWICLGFKFCLCAEASILLPVLLLSGTLNGLFFVFTLGDKNEEDA